MSRQLEQKSEERFEKRKNEILIAVEFGLAQVIEASGGLYAGFAFKNRGSDCLLILKSVVDGIPQVSFVGSEDLGGCLIKACRLGRGEKLVWKADKYVGPS